MGWGGDSRGGSDGAALLSGGEGHARQAGGGRNANQRKSMQCLRFTTVSGVEQLVDNQGAHALPAVLAFCRQRLGTLGYDPAAAEQLEGQAAAVRGEMRQWKDRVDELSSQLAGGLGAGALREGCQLQSNRACGSYHPQRHCA